MGLACLCCVCRFLMLLLQKIQWTLPIVQYNFTSTWIWFITSLLLVYSCFTVSGQLSPFFSMHKSDQAYAICSKGSKHCTVFVFTIAQLLRSLDMSVLDSGWLRITSRFPFNFTREMQFINQLYFYHSLMKELSCWALYKSVKKEGGRSFKPSQQVKSSTLQMVTCHCELGHKATL